MIDTLYCIPFDLPLLIFKKELGISNTFSVKVFLLMFKEIDATSDRRSVLYVNVLFAQSDVILDVMTVKTNVT